MKHIITLLAVTLLTITTCYAEGPRTVGTYKRHMATNDHKKKDFDHTLHHMLYLNGVADGYTAINKRLKADKQKLLYCLTDAETLNGEDYMRILEEALALPDNSIADQLSVAEAMLLALKEEFPCQ